MEVAVLKRVVIVGAGPAGIGCALQLVENGIDCLLVDKGCIADSVYRFPVRMRFFSDAPSLEVPGYPMEISGSRPTRDDAIGYYRKLVASNELEILQREKVVHIDGTAPRLTIRTSRQSFPAVAVVIATGFFDQPNLLEIPGENLEKVSHYFTDGHPYFGSRTAVIGGRNSAGIAACELAEAGARVLLIHRGSRFGMKPWILEDLERRIARGQIEVLRNSTVATITEDRIAVDTPLGREWFTNDFVFAMTGYRPDFRFLIENGIPLQSCGTRPIVNPETLESGRPGVYLAGSIVAGIHCHEIGIEKARLHGVTIANSLRGAAEVAA